MTSIDVIIEKMEQYGGTFEQCLAKAYRCADQENRLKILTTWNNYFSLYASTRIPAVK